VSGPLWNEMGQLVSGNSVPYFRIRSGYCHDAAALSNIGDRVYVRVRVTVRVSVRVIFSITWPRPDTATYV